MEAALVEVAFEEGGAGAEGSGSGCGVARAIVQDLLGLKGGVVVVAADPMADALAEGEVVKIAGDLADRAVGDGDGVDEALVVKAARAEETHVEG